MADRVDIFNLLSLKIAQLSITRTQSNRDTIKSTLSELNSLNYRYPLVTNPTKAVLLVNQCCTLILPEDVELVTKCCQLITNLISKQKVSVEGRTLKIAVLWCLQALKTQQTIVADVLTALDALLRGSTEHGLILEIVNNGTFMAFIKDGGNLENIFHGLQCLEACIVPPDDEKANSEKITKELKICLDVFLSFATKPFSTDVLIHLKIYILCLRGIQNVIRRQPDLVSAHLSIILGLVKSFMLLGIPGIDFIPPQKLIPSVLSIPEPTTQVPREKGGKLPKHKKPKPQAAAMRTPKNEIWEDGSTRGYTSVNTNIEDGYCSVGNTGRTSDSDFSDTEGGNLARLVTMKGRLRQTALSLFIHTIKLTEKNVMFSYWSNFIPEKPLGSKHNLITCILKETSNKGRMAALNALLILLSQSKIYLAQAEKGDNLSFTPFSVILGLTITELHRCLSLALSALSVPLLTLTLKCFATLVQTTPYHRLCPGLITKVIRNVKPFIYHKDSTVQVSALIVLGSVLASEPLMPETKMALLKNVKPKIEPPKQVVPSDSFEFADFSSDEEYYQLDDNEIPWLLQRCLENLGTQLDGTTVDNNVPTAVQLESLQVLPVMSRNYFDVLLAPYLNLITKCLEFNLSSKYSDIQLHAGRAIDFIGQSLSRSVVKDTSQGLTFWQSLLGGSLVQLFQYEQGILRMTACDCLGSIGSEIFQQLSRDKQILCITLLFTCSRDEESLVKGAAVRALAICVLYPILREDPGFVVDTAETVYAVLQDSQFLVRVKASWALANLSDALVLNTMTEDFPKSLLLKLMKISIEMSNTSDKIRVNTVRALGNFLQLIGSDLLGENQFQVLVKETVTVLLKCCTSSTNMKVRWNSCHAVGSMMKNEALYGIDFNWRNDVFNTLTDLVVNFRNFKVRINAALALSVPKCREFYGQYYQPIWVSLIKALETAENMEDFTEYKHRDNLIEQICLTLGHMMTLLTPEDLITLKETVNCDILKIQFGKVWERLLPEKSTILFDAHAHVKSLTHLSNDAVISCLSTLLKQQF